MLHRFHCALLVAATSFFAVAAPSPSSPKAWTNTSCPAKFRFYFWERVPCLATLNADAESAADAQPTDGEGLPKWPDGWTTGLEAFGVSRSNFPDTLERILNSRLRSHPCRTWDASSASLFLRAAHACDRRRGFGEKSAG